MQRGPRRGGPSRIHQGLVGARALVGTGYLADSNLRAEYESEIAPRTDAALERVLAAIVPTHPVHRVLDLGAGTGAATGALQRRFGRELSITGVDRVAGPGIDVVADLRRGTPAVLRPDGRAGDQRFDLIVAAHVLNELRLDAAAQTQLVTSWARELMSPNGWMVLIEPALRETSRGLLELRDRLVQAGMVVVAPCLHQQACPALARPRDWCHDTAVVVESEHGARWRVDFSYLVLQAGRGTTVAPGAAHDGSPAQFRVVSDRLEEKGRLRIFGCGPTGRQPLVRQDRDATEANAAFGSLNRGDLVNVGDTREAGDGLRVGPTTTVQRLPVNVTEPPASEDS